MYILQLSSRYWQGAVCTKYIYTKKKSAVLCVGVDGSDPIIRSTPKWTQISGGINAKNNFLEVVVGFQMWWWFLRDRRSAGAVMSQRPSFGRGRDVPEAVVRQRPWCLRGRRSAEAVMSQRPSYGRSCDVSEAVVRQRPWCLRDRRSAGVVMSQMPWFGRGRDVSEEITVHKCMLDT